MKNAPVQNTNESAGGTAHFSTGKFFGADNPRHQRAILTHRLTMLAAIKRRIWLIGYDLEETRQLHAASGHFWKQAGVCIALALLRMGRLV